MNIGESVKDEAHKGLVVIIPKKKSRPVKFKDFLKVLKDSIRIKLAMISPFPGKYPKAASISHCQIEGEDPLTFFVVDKNFGWHFGNKIFKIRTIINPKIIWRGKGWQKNKEACMSFPFNKPKRIKRHEIIEVKYQSFFGKRRRKFYEFRAAMIQHEMDHFEALNIEDKWKNKK